MSIDLGDAEAFLFYIFENCMGDCAMRVKGVTLELGFDKNSKHSGIFFGESILNCAGAKLRS